MTTSTGSKLLIGGLIALSAGLFYLWVKGRLVFNRELAADVIDKYTGSKKIDRKNKNQDTYLFAWWYAISKNLPTFKHNGNVFITKTGDFPPSQ